MEIGISDELIYIFRVIIAGICGIVIGYERKSRAKEAGIRTHFIVASAAALMMIISKYGFSDLFKLAAATDGNLKLDPSRVASSIVSGVGFLGAGMIFVQKYTIKGLTTAAGIWATAGIGMAIGAGLYITGTLFTVVIYFAQVILHRDSKFLTVPHMMILRVYGVERQGFISDISRTLRTKGVIVEDYDVSRNVKARTFDYAITVEVPREIEEEEVLSLIEYDSTLETMR